MRGMQLLLWLSLMAMLGGCWGAPTGRQITNALTSAVRAEINDAIAVQGRDAVYERLGISSVGEVRVAHVSIDDSLRMADGRYDMTVQFVQQTDDDEREVKARIRITQQAGQWQVAEFRRM